ncbi:type II toxin-antitoxin system PemK/MazF family toxin [Candidatus Babeliales bacterium]|nr:type II toxin-antitoxin system PemK/MazF family toxin [Candidatus Babeliales bacterium]
MISKGNVFRGDIWLIDLDPTVGHEQSKKRPCVIISTDLFNNSSADLVVILPLTTKQKNVPWQVEIKAPDGGLKINSFIICDQIRTVSKQRLFGSRLGFLNSDTFKKIEKRIKILLEIY